ncbi:MAG: putative porin [Halioglobus sp.]
MKKSIFAVSGFAIIGVAGASAQVPQAEWEQFKAQFEAMSERVDALEIENQQLRATRKTTVIMEDLAVTNAEIGSLQRKTRDMSWSEKIRWKGDYRFRYESVDEEGKDGRERWRIRARPALVAKISDTTVVGFGLATGSEDPVSSNQTLGDGSTSKEINLDLAYATWRPIESSYVTAGIFANPYYRPAKSQLIFDGDFRQEGLAVGWSNGRFFANAVYDFIESDSAKSESGLFVAQIGANLQLFEGATLTAAAGYIDIPVKGYGPIYDDVFFGNSSVVENGVEVYAYDYKLYNGSIAVGLTAFDLPLSVFVDYVKNSDVDELDTGYLAGVLLGNIKEKGDWQVQYQYESLDANATLGLITNSDFAGGGTDVKGSTFSAKYAVDAKWYVGTTYFFNNTTGIKLGGDASYDRIQLDTGYQY